MLTTGSKKQKKQNEMNISFINSLRINEIPRIWVKLRGTRRHRERQKTFNKLVQSIEQIKSIT